ncbi:MAG TPA: dTDP-4-dehydrorhamnose 3,5-epimerase [Terriglobales bacterium]|nr:dTDP-4-dehydrorhamnose 3,5-epimerase [Terriglobales bacterium]
MAMSSTPSILKSDPALKVIQTSIPEIKIFEPRLASDFRGFFMESYNRRSFAECGLDRTFVQDNHSFSIHGVVRGLHYQNPRPQGKLVRVITGEIFDVAVDLRRSSPTFGNSTQVILSADNRRMLWVPEGFAHGFLVLSAGADVLYKTTEYYAPDCEHTLLWSDPQLGIEWPITTTALVSAKDASAAPFSAARYYE